MYDLLLEWRDHPYYGDGQHCNVPARGTYPKGGYVVELGGWLQTQRFRLGGLGRARPLADDERSRLQQLIDSGHLFYDPNHPSNRGEHIEDAPYAHDTGHDCT